MPPLPPDDPSHGGWSDLGEPAVPTGADAPADDRAHGDAHTADVSTRYTLGAHLGQGGMGVVHAAHDTALGRDVALKELRPELADNPRAVARLAREAAITSRLDHPGIVSVHDAGRRPDGRPFYTMRLVRGRTLARAAAEARTADARRQLVRHVLAAADAMAAAHDAGVVHRDLKPQNILIGPHGETQVVDWGLATPAHAARDRWLDLPSGPERDTSGTSAYMAPEQARGEPADPRHDVWSLGVTLAEVVGGARGELPSELAAIVARATAPAPADRYPDAAAFADDLLRWFEGRRVAAYAYSPGELARRALSAYRLPLGIGAVGLLGVIVAVAVGFTQTRRSLDRALSAEAEASAALADLRLEQAVAATRAGARETAERLALAVLRQRDDPLARGVFAAFGRAERPALLADAPGTDCAWSALPEGAGWVLCGGGSEISRWEAGRVVWTAPVAAVGAEVRGDVVVAWAVTGATTAIDAATGDVRGYWPRAAADWEANLLPRMLWADTAPMPPSEAPPSGYTGRIQVMALSADGRLAALSEDGTLVLARRGGAVEARVPTEVQGDHTATAVAWTPGGDLVVGSLRGRVYLLSGRDGSTLAMGATGLGAIGAVRVSPDGRYAALDGATGGVGLWRIDTSTLVGEIPAEAGGAFAFTDAGLAIHDGRLRTWRLPTGAPAVVRGPTGLADVAISPDGGHLATAGGEGFVLSVDLSDGRTTRTRVGDRVVKTLAFDRAGALLATGMATPFAAVLDGEAVRPLAQARPLRRVAWRDGGEIVGVDMDAGLFAWARHDASPTQLASDRLFMDLERDGDALVVLDADGRVDRLDGDRFTRLAELSGARAVALRGDLLAIALRDAISLRSGGAERLLPAPDAGLVDLELSPDGTRLAAAGLDGDARVWNVVTGELLGRLPGHEERIVAVTFLPDGDLATASWDKTARVWDLGALSRPVEALAAEVETAWGRSPTVAD